MQHKTKSLFICIAAIVIPSAGNATETTSNANSSIEEIEVIGITPTSSIGLPKELIPYQVQSATSEDIERAQSLSLTDFMNRNLGSVHINEAQSNPLQPDVQYRGFTASPLLGLPQGIASALGAHRCRPAEQCGKYCEGEHGAEPRGNVHVDPVSTMVAASGPRRSDRLVSRSAPKPRTR